MKDDNSIDEKKPAPRLRRIGDIGINLFAPLAETRWMLRSCRHMLDQHKTRLKRLMPDRQPESPVCMTWEEAVRASGLTVDELDRRLRRRRMFWRTGFWLMMIPDPALSLSCWLIPPKKFCTSCTLILVIETIDGSVFSTISDTSEVTVLVDVVSFAFDTVFVVPTVLFVFFPSSLPVR